jgi:hypothetical protein
MHILRIDYKTGLRIDFGFTEKRAATEALSALDEAKSGSMVIVVDDHGHEGHVVKDGLLACVLTDLDAEVAGQMDVQQRVAELKASLAPETQQPARWNSGTVPVRAVGDAQPFSA